MMAGRLRFRVEIQEATESVNSVGEVVQAWSAVGTVWASIDPLRGQEKLVMAQVKPTIDTKITMRGNAAPYLSPKHRMIYGNRVFDIESVVDIRSVGAVKEIFCKEQA